MKMRGSDLSIQHLNNRLPGRGDTEMENIKEVYSREKNRRHKVYWLCLEDEISPLFYVFLYFPDFL